MAIKKPAKIARKSGILGFFTVSRLSATQGGFHNWLASLVNPFRPENDALFDIQVHRLAR
jgi:hypothetical protein